MSSLAPVPLIPSCSECGTPFTRGRGPRDSHFCSTPCRKEFNNRRARRGAEIYDLFMTMRFDRQKAIELGVWSKMCQLGATFRAEDTKERNTRQSWQKPSKVFERKPANFAKIMQKGPTDMAERHSRRQRQILFLMKQHGRANFRGGTRSFGYQPHTEGGILIWAYQSPEWFLEQRKMIEKTPPGNTPGTWYRLTETGATEAATIKEMPS